MRSVTKKALISAVAAGMLSTAAIAVDGVVDKTDAADFRVIASSTNVYKDNCVTIAIDLLKEDGTLDTVEGLYGNTVTAKCVSAIGTCTDATVENGKAFITVKENVVGEDTVDIAVLIQDPQGDQKILSPKTITIKVNPLANQAKGLEIIKLESAERSEISKDFNGNSSISCTKLKAGEPFTVKVEAISTDDNETDNTFQAAQNSEVTLRFIGLSDTFKNNEAVDVNKTVVKTFTGEMKNGIAYIDIPAEGLTKAGCYNMQALTPTDNTDVTKLLDGKPVAISEAGYKVCLNPLEMAQVGVEANVSDIYRLADDNQTKASVTLTLLDKYGNVIDAANDQNDQDIVVQLSVNDDQTFTVSPTTVTIGKDKSSLSNAATLSIKERDNLSDTQAIDAVVTASVDGLESGSATVKAYKQRLWLDWNTTLTGNIQYIIDQTNVILGTTLSGDANSTKAGNAFRFVENNTTDNAALVIYAQTSGTDETNITNKPITVELCDSNLENCYSINTTVEETTDDRNRTFALKVTKAAIYDKMKVTYGGTDAAYAPVVFDFPGTLTINVAEPNKIETYQGTWEGEYIYIDPATLPAVDSVTVDLNKSKYVYFDANETNVTTAGLSNLFLVSLQDAYGNDITTGSVALSSVLLDDSNTLNLDGSDYVTFDYTDKAGKSDVISITAALVDPKEIDVNIIDTTPVLDKISVNLQKNTVLRGSYLPFTISLFGKNGESISGSVDIAISDPTKVAIYQMVKCDVNESNTSSLVTSGGSIKTGNTYVIKGLSLGDVQLDLRNVAGTVTQSATVKVVDNVAEDVVVSSSSSSQASSSSVNPIVAVEDEIAAVGTVNIDGYYKEYDFNQNNAYDPSDWAYKVVSNGNVYQLLGTTPTEDNIFGWKPVDVNIEAPYDWYFVHYGEGKFDWAVVKPDCSKIYKLAGATENHTLSYDIDGDGQPDELSGLTCTIDGTQITFSKK